MSTRRATDQLPLALAPAEAGRVAELATQLATTFWETLDGLSAGPVLSSAEQTAFAEPLPRHGVGVDAALRRAASDVMARSPSRGHPRSFPFIDGSGLEIGALGDFLASALDTNVAGGGGAASLVEDRAWRWLAELLSFPAQAGIFTSGGSLANLTALTAARRRALPDVRERGVRGARAAVYCSQEAHHSIQRACDVLGLGRVAARSVPVDDRLRLRPDALAAQLRADADDGAIPVAVVATAGTTSTGAVDPLDAIADVCDDVGVWLHVDGAYGAPVAATSYGAELLHGLDRADSVATDPHKWLYLPKSCGCLLVQRAEDLEAAFAEEATYLENVGDGPLAGPPWPIYRSLEFSRPTRGLKLWLALLAHGADAFVGAIEHDLENARAVAAAVGEAPDLELLDEPQLSIVVFRHAAAGLTGAALDAHNRRLLDAMQRDGRVLLTGATVRGAFALRPCFVGHRTSRADALQVVAIARELGAALAAGP